MGADFVEKTASGFRRRFDKGRRDLATADLFTVTPVAAARTIVGVFTNGSRLKPGDRLVLYTDGLVETRHHPIDERLETLRHLLERPDRSLEETCDRLLQELRRPDDPDDVALLIARTQPFTRSSEHRQR